jgi:hypothetical protein
MTAARLEGAAVCRQLHLPASVGAPDQALTRRCEQSCAPSDGDETQPAVEACSIEVPAMPVGVAHEVGHLRGSGTPDRAVAVARCVAFPQKSIQQAHIGQQPARSGWQRLSDPRRSTHSTLDRYHPAARRQIERRHRSGGAGAQDQDIGLDRSAQRLIPCGKRRTLSIPERSSSSAARGPTAAATACAAGCRSSTSTTDGNGPLVGPARVSTTPIWSK